MLLVVGLGNVGARYSKNRHNVGFLAADEITNSYNFPAYSDKFSGRLSMGNIRGSKVAVIKPVTLMNNSGLAVSAVARFFKITNNNIFVIHDDLDLACGKVRVKLGGSSGGHNGIRSIDSAIGKDYWRIRVGIGRPDCKSKVTPYVLSDFSSAQRLVSDPTLASISCHLPVLLGGDADLFMNRIASNITNK